MSNRIPVNDITPPPDESSEYVDLYASRTKIHTRAFKGLFRTLRMAGGAVLLLIFFGTVWLNRNGHQAVWWDLPERKFYIFGATFWPQDFILLSGILIVAAFGLFFITVYAGRVWCGYTCPQSVWTWMFMWCEKVTEGDRNQRIRLDHAPMSAGKLLRKLAKHSLWLMIGFATGMTFVGYFSPIRDLCIELFTGEADGWAYFWVGFFTLATYLNAGWLREQVCIYMCPYARFQSVMFDKDTLVISYDRAVANTRAAQEGNRLSGSRARRLHRLHAVRSGLPDRHRHSRRPAGRVHWLRGLCRRLQHRHGQDGLPSRPDSLHNRTQFIRAAHPYLAPTPDRLCAGPAADDRAADHRLLHAHTCGAGGQQGPYAVSGKHRGPDRKRLQREDHEQGPG